ncbi:hypothetical protein COU18_02630 [Candidatus Kaiserbacteria bacterium CG10_big_fil_rev_8_21_14_0_10_51_14]|uniref:Penicillin-binding protein transpeptidase domain-containing protein n=1 Tax=Candidatus Kaiserbacteria bacterium CG10_big_fil_rev_8_21_14_0_10_51_14 TaxID=1974610 RepID=A0A2H0UCZ7_9BACT|nr:MAG: hypothetical protein COU18_02630 [Candidatus Kaiserbacteria bacterium CG10_big_fil_rev_8_21_14_0_10_51_14]
MRKSVLVALAALCFLFAFTVHVRAEEICTPDGTFLGEMTPEVAQGFLNSGYVLCASVPSDVAAAVAAVQPSAPAEDTDNSTAGIYRGEVVPGGIPGSTLEALPPAIASRTGLTTINRPGYYTRGGCGVSDPNSNAVCWWTSTMAGDAATRIFCDLNPSWTSGQLAADIVRGLHWNVLAGDVGQSRANQVLANPAYDTGLSTTSLGSRVAFVRATTYLGAGGNALKIVAFAFPLAGNCLAVVHQMVDIYDATDDPAIAPAAVENVRREVEAIFAPPSGV